MGAQRRAAPPPPVNPQWFSPAESRERTLGFFQGLGMNVSLLASAERLDAYSSLIRAIVSSLAVTSHVSCTITISPAVTNQYNTLQGGAVASVAEAVGMACACSAAGDKEMFLGEISTEHLAAARLNVLTSGAGGPRAESLQPAGWLGAEVGDWVLEAEVPWFPAAAC